MRLLIVGDPHGKVIKKIPKDIDLILITGDLGKANLARKHFFDNLKRKKRGLGEMEETPELHKKMWEEVYDSSLNVARFYSKIAPTYSILGNVGTATDSEIIKEEKKLGIKLPKLRKNLKRIKNLHLVRNSLRKINGLRIGFLEDFLDRSYVEELNIKDKEKIKRAKEETAKARDILKWFGKVDILVSHQPPYKILDKLNFPGNPYNGKHSGSKVVLDYIKKEQPNYVFCGHIHEGKGERKVGKTRIVNVGSEGDYFVLNIK